MGRKSNWTHVLLVSSFIHSFIRSQGVRVRSKSAFVIRQARDLFLVLIARFPLNSEEKSTHAGGIASKHEVTMPLEGEKIWDV
jgi:hypothetical protein